MQSLCQWQALGRPVLSLQCRCVSSRWLAQARQHATADRCRQMSSSAAHFHCSHWHSRLPLHQGRHHPYRGCLHSSPCRAASSAAAEVEAAPPAAEESGSGNVIALLRARGLIQDTTSDALEEVAASTALSVYLGFDPTAESLHLGHLLGIVVLTWFQRCGHQAIALLGGATGRVGDPSGTYSPAHQLDAHIPCLHPACPTSHVSTGHPARDLSCLEGAPASMHACMMQAWAC